MRDIGAPWAVGGSRDDSNRGRRSKFSRASIRSTGDACELGSFGKIYFRLQLTLGVFRYKPMTPKQKPPKGGFPEDRRADQAMAALG